MREINKKSMEEYLKSKDVLNPRKYIIYGTYLVIIIGLLFQTLAYGLSHINLFNYPAKVIIVLMVLYGIISLFIINAQSNFLFMYKSIFALYFSVMCIVVNIAIYESISSKSIIIYSVLILFLLISVSFISFFTYYNFVRSKNIKEGKKGVIPTVSLAGIGIFGMLAGSYIANHNTQNTNLIILFVGTLIFGLGLCYAAVNCLYKYALAKKYKIQLRK